MLMDNDFVKAEHKYRGHKLADIYPKTRRGLEAMTRAERPSSQLLALKRLGNAAAEQRHAT